MNMVGHDDEGMKFVAAFVPIVFKRLDKEFGIALDLEETAAVIGSAGDKEGSGARHSGGNRHAAIVTARTSGAEAPCFLGMILARLKPCP
jgi:hypothetical protein